MHIASYVHVYSVIIEVTIDQSVQDGTKDQQRAADTESKQCSSLCINTLASQVSSYQANSNFMELLGLHMNINIK